MSILDIKKEIKWYILATIFVLIFGIIYEIFSHQVYSPFMYLAFLIPFVGLVIKIITIKKEIIPTKVSDNFFNASILTFTLGSIIKGFLDIYGTTNSLISIYLILGSLYILLSLITFRQDD